MSLNPIRIPFIVPRVRILKFVEEVAQNFLHVFGSRHTVQINTLSKDERKEVADFGSPQSYKAILRRYALFHRTWLFIRQEPPLSLAPRQNVALVAKL